MSKEKELMDNFINTIEVKQDYLDYADNIIEASIEVKVANISPEE